MANDNDNNGNPPVIKRRVSLPYNSPLVKYAKSERSSDDVATLVNAALSPGDNAYTFPFRYFRLLVNDIGGNKNTQGATIDYVSTNVGLGIGITGVISGLCIANFLIEYRKQMVAINNNNYEYMLSQYLKLAIIEKKHQLCSDARAKANAALNANPPGDIRAIETELKDKLVAAETSYSDYTEELNAALQTILAQNPTLAQKYTSAKVEVDKGKLKVVFARNTPFQKRQKSVAEERFSQVSDNWLVNKVLYPAWTFLGLSSFAYWVMWIGASMFTGELTTGIAGVSPLIAFGIPIAVGLLYPAIKIYHYLKNKVNGAHDTDETKEKKDSAIDANTLLRQAILFKRFDFATKQLQAELDYYRSAEEKAQLQQVAANPQALDANAPADKLDDTIRKHVGVDPKLKGLASGVIGLIGGFVCAQYAAWVVTDFMSVVLKVAAPVGVDILGGVILMVIAGVIGLYRGIARYLDTHNDKNLVKNLPPKATPEEIQLQKLNQLEADFARLQSLKQVKLNELKDAKTDYDKGMMGKTRPLPLDFLTVPKLPKYNEPQFFTNIERTGENTKTKWKKRGIRVFKFLDSFCTGAFFARIFFVPGNAIFLPFAAAALSNPYTIGIVVAVGLVYAGFRLYQYHKTKQEDRARELAKQRSERIACLEKNVAYEQLCVNVLEKRLDVIKHPVSVPAQPTDASSAPVNQPLPFFKVKDQVGLVAIDQRGKIEERTDLHSLVANAG